VRRALLPTPSLTATLIPRIGNKARVIVHGERGWKKRLAGALRMDSRAKGQP